MIRPGAHGRTVLTALAALATAASLLVVPTGPAVADPDLAAARQQASALRTQVEALTVAAELATEHYDGITDQLATLATREGLARRQLDAARVAHDGSLREVEARARAIYMAGGTAGLYATLLDGQDIGDLLSRIAAVHAVMDASSIDVADRAAVTDQAADIALELGQLADQQSALEAQAEDAAAEVTRLLDQSQALLEQADARVRTLVADEAARAHALAWASSQTRLAELGLLQADAPPGTGWAPQAIAAARAMIGRPYQWGAVGPETFDCSGLTGWAYRQAGLSLPRTSRQQWFAGRAVPLNELAPGDLLFWATDVTNPSTIHHVGIYVGGGRMIDAPRTGMPVRETGVLLDGLIGAIRPGV
ncbi:MAG TPA: NlpC/P60 family protein [Actinomycetes bacterium]|nr:NlpC/P60 family protein [Actinomycetes bacterium]